MLPSRNPHDSQEEEVKVKNDPGNPANGVFMSVLRATGFRQIAADAVFIYFLPCPVGTFSNVSSKGSEGCTSFPPGI